MASFEVKNANILNKILFLEKYLEKQSENTSKEESKTDSNKVNEDDLVEIAEDFIECKDASLLEEAVNTIHKLMDIDSNEEISNDEVKKFKEVLSEIGLSAGELIALFDKYENEVSDDVNKIETKDLSEIDLNTFKEIVAKYPKLEEVIEEVGYDKFFDLIDTNGDGVLNSDEINKTSNLDGSVDDLSYDDIQKLLEDNDIEITDVEKEVDKDIEDIETEQKLFEAIKEALEAENQPAETQTVPTSNDTGSVSGGSYSGNVSGGNSSSNSSSNTNNDTSSVSSTDTTAESIEELEKQKDEKTDEIETLKGDFEGIYNGTDDSVSDKKEEMDEAEEKYNKALEEDAEENPEIAALKEQKEENEKDINKNTELTVKAEEALVEAKQAVSDKENEIKGLESEKGALESSLDALNSTKETEANKEELASKKQEINDKITKLNNQIKKENEALDKLKDKETECDKALEDLKEAKTELEKTRDKIESDIKTKASAATKKALEAFQKARDNFESAKEKAAEDKRAEIEKLQSEIDDIEVKIQELKAAEIEKDNQISPWGQYNEERGQALADAANALYGNVSSGGGYCATGVSQAIQKAFGYSTSGNGCDYGNTLSALDDWVEITDSITSAEELKNLPAGAIVSWSPYNTSSLGRLYGHVYISDGQGHEISDFKADITTYYADNGSEYRVFLPT